MTSSDTLSAAMPAERARNDRAIGLWLLGCAGMVFAMIVIGGITRLTESGLSIVVWKPITGFIPPLSEAEWQAAFDQYRLSPEYLKVNAGMSLADFKTIFFWEYLHRLWGRLIGVAFLLPFLWFLVRGRIAPRLAPRLALLFVLGGLQGALGWYMVQSGLVDIPAVSQYRLAAHLSLAFVIYGALLWVGLGLIWPESDPVPDRRHRALRGHVTGVLAMVSLTIVSGAFVAGLDAGLIYNTFPLMEGQIVPPSYWQGDGISPAFEEHATVQFHHRVLAILTFLAAIVAWWRSRWLALGRRARSAANALAAAACLQVALGITTLLMAVPVALGAAHQAGAVLVFSATLWLLFEMRDA